jgi:hypothetical protein
MKLRIMQFYFIQYREENNILVFKNTVLSFRQLRFTAV